MLRDRLPPDPRLRLRRDEPSTGSAPPQIVSGVMTALVSSVQASVDLTDVARIFVDEHVRSVPVPENGRTVGIVSRRDLLTTLARPDRSIRADLLRAVEDYTGEAGPWDVEVTEGAATVRRTDGAPGFGRCQRPAHRRLRAICHRFEGHTMKRISPRDWYAVGA